MNVLLEFGHGLGDAVQLTAVLRHLREFRPDWEVDVLSLRGKHTALRGLCRQSLIWDGEPDGQYDQRVHLHWWECSQSYADSPSTKAEKCLRDVFQIKPREDLCRYLIQPSVEDFEDVQYHVAFDRPVVLIHYEGNTSCEQKNLSHELVGEACRQVVRYRCTPVILDWDHRSPLPDHRYVYCFTNRHPLWRGTGTGDAGLIAALCDQARLMIGIDSGPLHVAVAREVPTIGVWRGHHPVHYICPSPNAVHLVPLEHASRVHQPQDAAVAYFEAKYRHACYTDLRTTLLEQLEAALT